MKRNTRKQLKELTEQIEALREEVRLLRLSQPSTWRWPDYWTYPVYPTQPVQPLYPSVPQITWTVTDTTYANSRNAATLVTAPSTSLLH